MSLKVYTETPEYCVEYKAEDNGTHGEVVAKFWVNPLTPSQLDRLINKHKKVEWDAATKREQKQRFVDHEFLDIMHDRIDKTIANWEGLIDEKGDDIDCIRENKIKVYEHNPDVIQFVLDQADEIGKEQERNKVVERKNSKSSPATKPTKG